METGLLNDLIAYLEPEGFSKTNGGSFFFDRELFFMPAWLHGHKSLKQRINYHPEDNWLKVSILIVGEHEYESIFEGTCPTMSHFKMLYEEMLNLNEK